MVFFDTESKEFWTKCGKYEHFDCPLCGFHMISQDGWKPAACAACATNTNFCGSVWEGNLEKMVQRNIPIWRALDCPACVKKLLKGG